jgi:hypothetical protein
MTPPEIAHVDWSSWKKFVAFWKNLYDRTDDHRYLDRIDKPSFTADDIIEFYTWKNEAKKRLSRPKAKTIQDNVISKLAVVNRLKSERAPDVFDNTFFQEFGCWQALTWRLFLRHIIAPARFPILDANALRAYLFFANRRFEEPPEDDAERESLYQDRYIPFFDERAAEGIDRKALDEAFFEFGKFVKLYHHLLKSR